MKSLQPARDSRTTSSVRLSVIIVNFETPDYTRRCIESIYRNKPSFSFEIILIDNGSRDGSFEALRARFPEVAAIETGENLGFARANNLGINNARGKYVLLLNSDTKILDDALERMVADLEADPAAGAVGPRQLDGRGKLQLSWGSFPTFVAEIFRKVLHHRLSLNDFKVRDYLETKFAGKNEVGWVSGSCLMAPKETLVEAGLLDPHFFMYFEDIDLCERIRRTGKEIHFNSDITIVHYGGVSAKKNLLHVLVEYRHSQIYFTKKYYGLGGVALLKTLLFAKNSANFVRWGAAFARDKAFHRNPEKNFARLLLSKKTIELIFRSEPRLSGLGVHAR